MVTPETLNTARFSVRPWTGADAEALHLAIERSRSHLLPWIAWAEGAHSSPAASLEEIERLVGEWEAHTNFVLGILSPDGRVLGGTGFHPRGGALGEGTTEIGMWMRADVAGQGLGKAVLREMLRWAFTEWRWARVEWRCDARNLASAAVARRVGMVHEGTLREQTLDMAGDRCDTMVFAALRSEWPVP